MPVKVSIKSIEDYYDKSGKYLKTLVILDEVSNDFSSGKAYKTFNKEEYKQPLLKKETSINLNENHFVQPIAFDSSAEKESVKNNIISNIDNIKTTKSIS